MKLIKIRILNNLYNFYFTLNVNKLSRQLFSTIKL